MPTGSDRSRLAGRRSAAVALAGALGDRTGRWARSSPPFPVVSTSLLVVIARGQPSRSSCRRTGSQHRLSDVASELVGAPVTVDCQSRGQEMIDIGNELGLVRYDAGPAGAAHPDQAAPVRRPRALPGGRAGSPTRDEVVAVHVLSHEARHMAGQTVEAEAECAAMQRDARTARLLGAVRRRGQGTRPDVLARRLSADGRRVPLRRVRAGGIARRAPARRALGTLTRPRGALTGELPARCVGPALVSRAFVRSPATRTPSGWPTPDSCPKTGRTARKG